MSLAFTPTAPIADETSTAQPDTDLAVALAQAQEDARRARQELAAFREQVTEVAHREADDRGWCEDFDDVMVELGLPRRCRDVSGTLTFTVDFRAKVNGLGATGTRVISPDWVEASVRHYFDDAELLDGDFSDVVIVRTDRAVSDLVVD